MTDGAVAQKPGCVKDQDEKGGGHFFCEKISVRGTGDVTRVPILDGRFRVRRGTIERLESSNPFSFDNFKKTIVTGQLPGEHLIKEAALAAAQRESLLVVTRYKELVPTAKQG